MSRIKGGKKNGDRKSDRCGNGGIGTIPGHLERRQRAYDNLANGTGRKGAKSNFDPLAFHRPGSNKK